MERSMHDETDSDGSVLSEDVLTSIYPVKPRKVPKASTVPRPSAMSAGDGEDGEYDSKLVEQTLTFLDAIKRNKKDLYNAECERERFESQGVVSRFVKHVWLHLSIVGFVCLLVGFDPSLFVVSLLPYVTYCRHTDRASKTIPVVSNRTNAMKETTSVSCRASTAKLFACRWS